MPTLSTLPSISNPVVYTGTDSSVPLFTINTPGTVVSIDTSVRYNTSSTSAVTLPIEDYTSSGSTISWKDLIVSGAAIHWDSFSDDYTTQDFGNGTINITSGGSYTINVTDSGTITLWDGKIIQKDRKTLLLEKLKNNLSPTIITRKKYDSKYSPQELKARMTLRDMISESEWRRYITNGFVMIKGASGKWYQVFNTQERTKVYENGKLVASICIHTLKDCPPTDHILNIKMIVEMDEEAVYKLGNVSLHNTPTLGNGGINIADCDSGILWPGSKNENLLEYSRRLAA